MSTKLLVIESESNINYQSALLEEDCANFLISLKKTVSQEQDSAEHLIQNRSTAFKNPVTINFYDSDDNYPSLMDEHTELNLEPLLGPGDSLVTMSDIDLVPHALFVAMAQMKVVNLTESDKVGCYKDRPIGFAGLGCKHCGGQPGFGKFFPASVRSLAQTTTSQTILKHIGSKCRFCPTEIRAAVLDLQHQQAIKEAATTGRPRYGSRKVFFQRIWARLHNEPIPDNPSSQTERAVLPPGMTFIPEVSAAAVMALTSTGSLRQEVNKQDDQVDPPSSAKAGSDDASTTTEASREDSNPLDGAETSRRCGGLPTKKNLMKRKQLADSESGNNSPTNSTPKRQHVEGAK